MSNIVQVPFYGDTLDAIQDDRGVWVGVKRACENVEVSSDAQARRLQRSPWAVTTMMVATGADGKSYEMLFVHLDSLPMWLATIEASRVKDDVRPKLIAYQKECARVLRDHFFGRRTDAVDVLAALVTQLPALIASSVNAAVDAAMKRSDERSLVDANTVGRAGASFINRALKECAKLLSGGDKERYRSILSASHVDLRAALQFNGTGRGWSNLPSTKWADCRATLSQMQRAAMRQSPDPQPTLPKVN